MSSQKNQTFAEDCYAKFNVELTHFLAKAVSGKTDLQDLSQEVYLRILRIKDPDLIISPRAYLYKIAIHVIDEWRNSSRQNFTHVSNKEEVLESQMETCSKYTKTHPPEPSLHIELNNALKSLPAVYSKTILMKWHYGMNYKELANELKVTERQVKRYIIKGYAALRTKLKNCNGNF